MKTSVSFVTFLSADEPLEVGRLGSFRAASRFVEDLCFTVAEDALSFGPDNSAFPVIPVAVPANTGGLRQITKSASVP
jgi:hypothetical protein